MPANGAYGRREFSAPICAESSWSGRPGKGWTAEGVARHRSAGADLHTMAALDFFGVGAAAGDSLSQYPLPRPDPVMAWQSAGSLREDGAESAMRWVSS